MEKTDGRYFLRLEREEGGFRAFVWILNMIDKSAVYFGNGKDNYLSFLDVGITKLEGKLMTKVCIKPTHKQQYINWDSNHPKTCCEGY